MFLMLNEYIFIIFVAYSIFILTCIYEIKYYIFKNKHIICFKYSFILFVVNMENNIKMYIVLK